MAQDDRFTDDRFSVDASKGDIQMHTPGQAGRKRFISLWILLIGAFLVVGAVLYSFASGVTTANRPSEPAVMAHPSPAASTPAQPQTTTGQAPSPAPSGTR